MAGVKRSKKKELLKSAYSEAFFINTVNIVQKRISITIQNLPVFSL